ncbi:type IX secretion system sortase PorU, partial [Bacteroidota bacterium]
MKGFDVICKSYLSAVSRWNRSLFLVAFGFLVLLSSEGLFAQKVGFEKVRREKVRRENVEGLDTIKWFPLVTEPKYDGSEKQFMMFEGAVFLDSTSLPYAIKNIPLSGSSTVRPVLSETTFSGLMPAEANAIKGVKLDNDISVQVNLYTERKKSFARLSFVPIRNNSVTGRAEKLVSYKLTYLEGAAFKTSAETSLLPSSISALNTGDWYKIAVSESGIHKITYADLEKMGMDVNSIDPRRLNVYGNGGGMVPQSNAVSRQDDLAKTAIEVVGESDGSFDSQDYILFYAQGPHRWVQDSASCGLFKHEFNVYSDKAYYFITVDKGFGRRIVSQGGISGSPTHTITTFTDYQFREADKVNLIKSGRDWFGEEFDLQTTYGFDFGFSNVVQGEQGFLASRVLAKSLIGSTSFSFSVNGGSPVGTVSAPKVFGGYSKNAEDEDVCTQVQFGSGNTNVAIKYNKGAGNPTAVGWLDYLEIILKRKLTMSGGQMGFRDLESVGFGNKARFEIANANSSVRVWEVTDPTNVSKINLSLQGSVGSFVMATDSLRQLMAFDGSVYYSIEPIGKIENQNLHGLSQADMIIVAHPDFLGEAARLANFHRESQKNPLSVHVVTPQQIYNEFSSGAQDVTAIRDFMRMFYLRSKSWKDLPRYLLLFGDASYDYKDRLAGNTNYVPTYQSRESLSPTLSHASDDYYGLLDDDEGDWKPNDNDALDIGIGRFVVRTAEDAKVVVDKIFRYDDLSSLAEHSVVNGQVCENGEVSIVSPDWRNRICFVGDDEDANVHMTQADQLAQLVDTMYPEYNISKIYFDSYVQESTSGGQRYPEANVDINNTVQRGALLINYTGHGGELGWAHERVLGLSDINSWTNASNLPVFVTATCEFTRYDDPGRISAGEAVHLNPNGGGIALFTTSRLVYSAPNFTLNKNFYKNLLVEQPWGPPTMGDVIRMTKVASGGSVNNRNFSLFGDPAQRLAYPLHRIETLTINKENVSSLSDTLNALELVTVTGRMRNRNGQLMPDFEGVVYPTVFDKASTITTLANDPSSSVKNFMLQKNIIYKGKATVAKGAFSFSFVVPKDIDYSYGFGRISYYAEGEGTNANGYFEDFVIGGSSDNATKDEVGPEINIYMNNESFVFGGTTNENPKLLAIVTDSNG